MTSSRGGPSTTEKLIGGLQWATTGSYVFLLGLVAAAWYFRLPRTDLSRLLLSIAILAVI